MRNKLQNNLSRLLKNIEAETQVLGFDMASDRKPGGF